jgi:hypothetical protein
MTTIGRKRKIGIAIESVAGTIESPTMQIPFLDLTLEPRHTPIGDVSARGTRMEQGCGSVEGKKWGEGTIQAVLNPKTSPYLLALALGDISSAPSGANFKHTIKRSEGDALTASIYVDNIVNEEVYANAVVNNLEISFADDVASINADILSKYPVEQTASLDAETKCPILYTFANATVKIGGEEAKVRDFSLSIANNAELIYNPSDNDVSEIVWKSLNISGRISMIFKDTTMLENYENLVKKTMEITFSNGTNNSIKITIPSFRVDNWNKSGGNDDIVHEEFDFVVEDSIGNEPITVEVINQTENYIKGEES